MKKIQCTINSVNLHFRRKLIKVPQNHYKLLTHKKKSYTKFQTVDSGFHDACLWTDAQRWTKQVIFLCIILPDIHR